MNDQQRIETAADNCEVLRARLAKYEDADGNPITTIAEQSREIERLNSDYNEACEDAMCVAREIERLRMQLVACGVVALANTPESAAKARDMHPDYMSASCGDVIRTVDIQMQLRAELTTLKAQPSGVVQWPDADEIMQMAFEEGQPSEDASGYYFELEEFDLFIQRLMEEVARLNSSPASAGESFCEYCGGNDEEPQDHCMDCTRPVSAGGVDERAGWTEKKPTEEGAYWIRGNGLEADALVQVKQEEGELWCNLHMRNSEPDFAYGYTIEQLSSEFEWLGPLQARAALSAPSHGEQVREGSLSRESLTLAYRLITKELETLANGSAIDRFKSAQDEFRSAIAATPSAGSQEQGE